MNGVGDFVLQEIKRKSVSSIGAKRTKSRKRSLKPRNSAAEKRAALENWVLDHPLHEIRKRLVDSSSLLFDLETVEAPAGSDFKFDSGEKPTLKIASVLCDVRIDILDNDGSEAQLLTDGMPFGLLTPKSRQCVDDIKAERADQLKQALSTKPDVVSFCEFALPPCDFHPEDIALIGGMDIFQNELIERIEKRYQETAQGILHLARDGKAYRNPKTPFICYGSAHCNLSRFNIGVVSPGGGLEKGHVLKRRRENPFGGFRETGGSSLPLKSGAGPLVQKKIFPARRAGELARVPDDNIFRTYQNEVGLICVLICSDAVDLNQAANIVRINRLADDSSMAQRINLVLVPAFNKSVLLFDACRDLSAMARTNVVVTNAVGRFRDGSTGTGRTRNMPESELYFDGYDSHQLSSKGVVSVALENGIRTYEIDLHFQRAALKRAVQHSRS